uniref:Adenylate kinase isoenzyme 6 homolog n=1 Tax=Amphimedon queenslandica TaxID=400682 RepID=A0A1X7SZ72_AMPQE
MASPQKVRALPNVLITGTPGTGKTLTASQVVERTGMSHFNVSELAKEGGLYEGWDEQFQSYILDEDKVVDELNDSLVSGGCIVEYHGCDFFPERWFDAIFVLRTDNALLYDRLMKRFLMHIDVLMLYRKFEMIPTKTF